MRYAQCLLLCPLCLLCLLCSVNDLARIVGTEGAKIGLNVEVGAGGWVGGCWWVGGRVSASGCGWVGGRVLMGGHCPPHCSPIAMLPARRPPKPHQHSL